MNIDKIKENIRILTNEWNNERDGDKLIYLNGQLKAWNEILIIYERK